MISDYGLLVWKFRNLNPSLIPPVYEDEDEDVHVEVVCVAGPVLRVRPVWLVSNWFLLVAGPTNQDLWRPHMNHSSRKCEVFII